jgi:hypothetical protein
MDIHPIIFIGVVLGLLNLKDAALVELPPDIWEAYSTGPIINEVVCVVAEAMPLDQRILVTKDTFKCIFVL